MNASNLCRLLEETMPPEAQPDQVARMAAGLLAFSPEPWALSDHQVLAEQCRLLHLRQRLALDQWEQSARDLITVTEAGASVEIVIKAAQRHQSMVLGYVRLLLGAAEFGRGAESTQ